MKLKYAPIIIGSIFVVCVLLIMEVFIDCVGNAGNWFSSSLVKLARKINVVIWCIIKSTEIFIRGK